MTALAAIMKERRVTSQQLADQTGISKRTIDNYRSDRNALTLAAGLRIADALGIDPHALLTPEP